VNCGKWSDCKISRKLANIHNIIIIPNKKEQYACNHNLQSIESHLSLSLIINMKTSPFMDTCFVFILFSNWPCLWQDWMLLEVRWHLSENIPKSSSELLLPSCLECWGFHILPHMFAYVPDVPNLCCCELSSGFCRKTQFRDGHFDGYKKWEVKFSKISVSPVFSKYVFALRQSLQVSLDWRMGIAWESSTSSDLMVGYVIFFFDNVFSKSLEIL